MKTSWLDFVRLPVRVRLGLLLILLFAVVSSARWIRVVASTARGAESSDEITAYESRFHELRSMLPSSGVVGYLTDPLPADLPRSESRSYYRRYVLAQYALAPVLLERGADPDLVIGDYSANPAADPVQAFQLQLLRDFGGGLMLFRRTDR